MADPLSITSAAVGFVSFAIGVAKTTTAFLKDAKTCSEDFTKLSLLTNEFALQLHRLGPLLETAERESGGHGTTQTLKRCQDVLRSIQLLFSPSGKLSLKDRISWALSKKKVARDLLVELEQCKSTLTLTFSQELLSQMSAETERASQERRTEAEERRRQQEERNRSQRHRDGIKRQEILNWLAPGSFEARHSSIGDAHAKHTGTWLLKELELWFGGGGERVVFCIGAAGVGKTFLSYGPAKPAWGLIGRYKVIQSLLDSDSTDVGVAYLYFDHKQAQLCTTGDYIASLTRQLQQQAATISSAVLEVFEKCSKKTDGSKPRRPGFEDLKALFLDSAVSLHTRTYIVLDAFDECSHDVGKELVELLRLLITSNESIYLFVASRPNSNLEAISDSSTLIKTRTINVIAGHGFQNMDLKSFLDHSLGKVSMTEKDRSIVAEGILSKAQGLFLLASLHVKSVLGCKNAKQRRKTLSALPQELSMAYKSEMARIQRNIHEFEIAKRALSWVYFAKRPLRMAELRHAIATEPIVAIEDGEEDCIDLEEESLTDPNVIIDCCGSLIMWEHSTDIVGFSHYTVSEYLAANADGNIEPELYVAQTCFTYSISCFDIYEQKGTIEALDTLISKVQRYPLSVYVAQFCGDHAWGFQRDRGIQELIISLLWSPSRRVGLLVLEQNRQAIMARLRGEPGFHSPWFTSKVVKTPLQHLSSWGLATLSELILSYSEANFILLIESTSQKWRNRRPALKISLEWNSNDLELNPEVAHQGQPSEYREIAPPLHLATEIGNEEMVDLLLSKGADVNIRGDGGQTALNVAARRSRRDIVKLLLDKGAEVHSTDAGPDYPYDPLGTAADKGSIDIVQLLLVNGASVNGQGRGAVHAAARGGHREVVKLLLDNAADVNAYSGYFGYALEAAAFGGYEEVVKLLLDNGANVNAEGGAFGCALQAASYHGSENIVKLLLTSGANVHIQGGQHGNALQSAAFAGHQHIVKLLLENGAKVNTKTDPPPVNIFSTQRYGTPLQAAVGEGHLEIVRYLLESGGDVNLHAGEYGTALQVAAMNNLKEIVTMLLENGAEVNSQGGHYGNALQAAVRRGHQEVAELLLEHGADINAQGGEYGDALQAAARWGHAALVIALLEKGAAINQQSDGEYASALQAAAAEGQIEVVRILLENGADVNLQGGEFGTALQVACKEGQEEIVELLLEKGAEVNAQGGHYGNALQAAARSDHQPVVKLLLEKGADVNARGGKYVTALIAAEMSFPPNAPIIKTLVEWGADMEWPGGKDGNALQTAARWGLWSVKLLLDLGADVNARGGPHGTALEAARKYGHDYVVKMLLERGATPDWPIETE